MTYDTGGVLTFVLFIVKFWIFFVVFLAASNDTVDTMDIADFEKSRWENVESFGR